MKRVGIITVCANNNYGNKLQNYALLNVLKNDIGVETKSIWVEQSFVSGRIKSFLKKIKRYSEDYVLHYNRRKFFLRFNKKYLNYEKIKINNKKDLIKLDKRYDNFIIGSDQVWNYELTNNFDVYFLNNISKKKNIAYAASIGQSEINPKYREIYINGISKFNYISVRENEAKEILEELCEEKKIEVTLDPTLLIENEGWNKIIEEPKCKPQKKFILNYFLGNLEDDYSKEINRVAKEYDCEIVNILDKNSKYYNSGPSEFLWYEKNAFLICTDSFHSSVFAFLFDKPFVVFKRSQKGTAGMWGRLDTLLKTFNIEDRVFEKKIDENNITHNYDEAYRILKQKRTESVEFLKKSLM